MNYGDIDMSVEDLQEDVEKIAKETKTRLNEGRNGGFPLPGKSPKNGLKAKLKRFFSKSK